MRNHRDPALALEPFRFMLSVPPDPGCAITGKQLLTRGGFDRAISAVSRAQNTNLRSVSASLFAKGYSRALCAGLFAYYFHDVLLDLSLKHIAADILNGQVTLYYTGPVKSASEDHRDEPLRSIFAGNLSVVLPFWAEETGVSLQTLWENVAVYLHHYYREWGRESELQGLLDPSSEWFGVPCLNPLAIQGRFIPHPIKENQQIRIRTTCCLKYKCGDGRHCYTCPGITDEQRVEQIIGTH